uniref:LVIVD repeat protein n=1 Tax=candidate division WOR-3 bacterium TaxID=2052148 RepID=A0A7V6CMS6_UNCW3
MNIIFNQEEKLLKKIIIIFILTIFSLIWADSLNCRQIGYYDTPGSAQDVAVSGNYAYVADWEAGLRIIDISNPRSPVEVGYYDTPGAAYGVAVSGNYAYVADAGAGLRIIDISNPRSPNEVGYYDTPEWALGVAVSNYAYVADATSGLRIIQFY